MSISPFLSDVDISLFWIGDKEFLIFFLLALELFTANCSLTLTERSSQLAG